VRDRLKWSVLALTQPAEIQLSLFPDFVCKADELALNFGEGLLELAGYQDQITAEQSSAIDALDKLIVAKRGQAELDFWTDDAVRSHASWEEIRVSARAVADAFGWKIQAPPRSDDIYLPASQ
jgi:hypothetical protein